MSAILCSSECDDVFPATSHWTTSADGSVKLRMSETGYGAVKPITVMTMMSETVHRSPNHIAMGKIYSFVLSG